jgi:acid phosphatase
MVAALGLDIPAFPLPNDTILFPNPYNSADIVPMGGYVTLERLTCNATAMNSAGIYIRAVINEAAVPWNSC